MIFLIKLCSKYYVSSQLIFSHFAGHWVAGIELGLKEIYSWLTHSGHSC